MGILSELGTTYSRVIEAVKFDLSIHSFSLEFYLGSLQWR